MNVKTSKYAFLVHTEYNFQDTFKELGEHSCLYRAALLRCEGQDIVSSLMKYNNSALMQQLDAEHCCTCAAEDMLLLLEEMVMGLVLTCLRKQTCLQ